ncbi:hypothetical protein Q669_06715 [Labrenzia sp. C1B10]|nr:hypothetical protein Q669_06715 [Labrenzia sp. C1B10]ERS08671.1 hypothetical protein Q675_18840 [Labrenzia sp. C1B70]
MRFGERHRLVCRPAPVVAAGTADLCVEEGCSPRSGARQSSCKQIKSLTLEEEFR